MAGLTLFVEDARRRPLPIGCKVSLSIDGQVRHEVTGERGRRDVAFVEVETGRVWTVRVRADGFSPAARFFDSSDRQDDRVVLCLVSSKQAIPVLPRYEQLPDDLRVVLERSEALDITLRKREISTHQTPVRQLASVTSAPSRLPDGRVVGNPADGRRRWTLLEDTERAGLLNLYAKMRSVFVGSRNASVWTYVQALREVARDRIHVQVDQALQRDASDTEVFHKPLELTSVFHKTPSGFHPTTSLKTREAVGNLQLTFYQANEDPTEFVVDADVDDAAGVGHAAQVIGNTSRGWLKRIFGGIIPGLPEGLTHPFDIHQLVIRFQGLSEELSDGLGRYEPCYKIEVKGLPNNFSI